MNLHEISLTYSATVKDGLLKIHARKQFDKDLIMFEAKEVELVLRKKRSRRSGAQNRYIHLLFTIFTNELNSMGNEFTMTEVKELCKAKFLLIDVINESTGEIIGQRIKGTSETTKTEMMHFVDQVIRWAAEYFSITLPLPGEQFELNYEK